MADRNSLHFLPILPAFSLLPAAEIQTTMILEFQAALNGDQPVIPLT
jgi:hypothetical protein